MRVASIAVLLAGLALLSIPDRARAQNSYVETDLVSDISGRAAHTDPNLVNPWGIVPGPTGIFWVSNEATGTSTLYNPDGTPLSLVVHIPGGEPTGIALANQTDLRFEFPTGDSAAIFIFVTEGGKIAAWNPGVSNDAVEVASEEGAVYTGVTLASTSSGPRLYAVDFLTGAIDVYDGDFQDVSLGGTPFVDPNLPENYWPFNIANIGGELYVAYAWRDPGSEEEKPGAGLGIVDVYDTNGTFLRRFVSNGALNAPWAMVKAPGSFGEFSGRTLIGNFGDGRINAFDDAGNLVGTLQDTNGDPIELEGLWGLSFGRGTASNRLYFAAGIEDETNGLFGFLAPEAGGGGEPPPTASCENESRGLGFWKNVCRRQGASNEDERGHRKAGHVLAQWGPHDSRGPFANAFGHDKNRGEGNGNGHGKGPRVSADSLDALLGCISGAGGAFGGGGCFTASCDFLQRHGRMDRRDRVAQQFLVLLVNRCAGLICDDQTLTCGDDDDDHDGDLGDHDGDDDEDDEDEDGFDPSRFDLHTVGDVIVFVNDNLCDGGSEASLSDLSAMIGCALSSGRDDPEDDEDEGEEDDASGISRPIARGRIEVKTLSGNPLQVSAGAQARLQVSSQPLSVVRLGVYDASGRLVARLLRDVAVGSPVEVRWDGKNLNGDRVPPGTYFYRAIGGGAAATGRIVILQ